MNLTLEQLKNCFSEGLSAFSLQSADVVLKMEQEYVFSSEEEPKTVYRLSIGKKRRKFGTKEALFDCLKEFAPFTVLSLEREYPSYEAFRAARAFEKISMRGILDRYQNAALFSLTAPAWLGGDVPCTKETKEKALKTLKDALLSHLKQEYDTFSEKDKKRLGDFEALFFHIEGEVLAAYRKLKKTPFLCDKFSMGKTDYTSPDGLWHFYHDAEFLEEARRGLRRLTSTPHYEVGSVFENALYAPLKGALLSAQAGFVWHCTISGSPATTYFFRLDENTKAWLMQFQDDYTLGEAGELEDFALYRSEKEKDCLFSSCTHEGFHVEM